MTDLRIGILGAARIAPNALLAPARKVPGVMVAAIAARDPDRARAFADRHAIGRVLPDYQTLVTDPDLNAVYIPLPNGRHAEWVLAAIAAGKHVLCEKPFTANATQAESIAERAATSDVTVMEAFHYRYHPLAEQVRALVATEIGAVRQVDTAMCFPLPRFSDIRYQFDLAGGALMDAGCYAVHAARTFGPGEPRVTAATAKTLRRDRRVDRAIDIQTIYPGGATGRIRASMWSSDVLRIAVRVTGEHGSVRVLNFVAPQYPHRITATSDGRKRRERVPGEATYTYQLRAFLAATRGEPANLTPPADSVQTMRVIDEAYRAAGLPIRP